MKHYLIEFFFTHGQTKKEWIEAKDGAEAYMIALVAERSMKPRPIDFMTTEYKNKPTEL
jgi:hypothetical protein